MSDEAAKQTVKTVQSVESIADKISSALGHGGLSTEVVAVALTKGECALVLAMCKMARELSP